MAFLNVRRATTLGLSDLIDSAVSPASCVYQNIPVSFAASTQAGRAKHTPVTCPGCGVGESSPLRLVDWHIVVQQLHTASQQSATHATWQQLQNKLVPCHGDLLSRGFDSITSCRREAATICPRPCIRAARCGPAPAHTRLACGAQRALLPVDVDAVNIHDGRDRRQTDRQTSDKSIA